MRRKRGRSWWTEQACWYPFRILSCENTCRFGSFLTCLVFCVSSWKVERWLDRPSDGSRPWQEEEVLSCSQRCAPIFSSHRRANTGLNHVVRVSDLKSVNNKTHTNLLATWSPNVEPSRPPSGPLRCRLRQAQLSRYLLVAHASGCLFLMAKSSCADRTILGV